MPKKKQEEAKDLDTLIAEINKANGENTIGYIPKMKALDIERISTGSLWLDYCVGGGFPVGRMVELIGNFSSGKSLISLKTIAEAQKLGKTCVYADCENSFHPGFAQKLGVDLNKLLVIQSSVGERTIDMIQSLILAGVDVIVIDSVASLVPMSEISDTMEQQTMGLHARLLSKACRKLTSINKKTLLIFINQIRQKIGGFSSYSIPTAPTGGMALGFYSSVRVEVKRGEDIEENKRRIGQVIKFKVQKNKTGEPFRNGYVRFIYKSQDCYYGFDALEEVISLGIILEIIQQKGAFFAYGEETCHGREGLKEFFRSNNKLLEKLKKEILNYNENEKYTKPDTAMGETEKTGEPRGEIQEVEEKKVVEKKGKKRRKSV